VRMVLIPNIGQARREGAKNSCSVQVLFGRHFMQS
jgi:hypothetical protein